MPDVRDILTRVQSGELTLDEAAVQLQGFEDLGHSRVDHDRASRNGAPEVIFGQGKTPTQMVEIMGSLASRSSNVLATRVQNAAIEPILAAFPDATHYPASRLIALQRNVPAPATTNVAVVCAGTSDLPVAEEARITAEFLGSPTVAVYDAGVAGLHRLLASIDTIRACRVVIVVAGMEGALPSVVGGLVDAPVIAVPTSVGYGASFGGVAALLGMLNSCASGVSVVNIDNGFGAGFLANRINRL
ncbi:nickel pincer cofactor biosynthesis protein LarB [Cerasicoccus arenae]|uniref:1-(5-phosphoribosyl)-5-amino-4-imidazole-carboxylate carboxylase n=1 Tax=Cerasicoccus arenae TaxID=424488 RepID=A0A8J3DHF8_9BACT|nr:nickel pincer cofactor biosynthesis protein LarB [Cerasicoccus arenae]GHC02590.1 1-(5-phosphoribosyl)-5-amino-4-imidazole-carboxylate carboxylase [Cerasicoccus arenae]